MNFYEWLNQIDKNNSRLEKIYKELVLQRYIDNHTFWNTILSHLNAAYEAGNENHTNKFKTQDQSV